MQLVNADQISLFDLGLPFGKMSPEPSQAIPAKTSESSSKSLPKSQTDRFLFLNLRKGSGNLQEPSWETGSASLGVSWTPSIGESPSVAVASTLSQILEEDAPRKHFLSAKACAGILRRAEKRGKALPPMLKDALEQQASAPATLQPLDLSAIVQN